MRQRRFLPSTQKLMVFEAVLLHGSVSAAARELHLSQSTASRVIAALEHQLGIALFRRQGRQLVPTVEARGLQRDITRALDTIQRATMSCVANPGGGQLNLSVLPTLAARWLAPKLAGFLDRQPGIQINLGTRIDRFRFEAEAFDAAITFGADDWPGAEHLKLFDERLTACAAPGFLDTHRINHAEDLATLPLLQLETRLGGWEDWFRAHGAKGAPPQGMLLDQFATMIQAAISGLGVALLPSYLADHEIAEGRLRPVLSRAVPSAGAYWLVWPPSRQDYPPLAEFRAWLSETIQPPSTA